MKITSPALVVAFLGLAAKAQAVINPTSLKVKIFEMRVSKNNNCSGAVSVFSTGSPMLVDLFSDPDLGSGVISTGTYHCVMFHISDIVTFTPQTSIYEQPFCAAGTTYSYDIFQNPAVSETPVGSPITASVGTTEDDPWIYLSDAPSPTPAANQTCFLRANAGTGGPCALAPLAILSDQTHTLVMDADLQVEQNGSTCILNPTSPVVISIR